MTMSETPRRGRGYSQPPSPPKDGVRKNFFMYNGTLLGNDDSEFPGFFRTSMRKRMEGFYKTWSDVPQDTKQRIWEDFLVVYYCGEYDPSTVYKKFMEQNAEKFRKFLADIKRRAMNNCKTVEDLYDAPKPPEMPTDAIWRKYTEHWNSEDQKARSEQNKKNRAKNPGKSHGFGRKGPAARLLERMKAGKPPSMLAIIKEVNAKKDKHGNPTGEFHSVSVNEATVEYEEVHKRVRPEQVPTEVVMDMSMCGENRSTAERKRNGRMLGFGTCGQAWNLTDVHPDPFRQNSVLQTQLDEMRQDMEARVRTEQEARVRAEEEALRRLQEEQDRRTELETFMNNMVQALQAVLGFVMPHIPSFPSFTSQQVPPRPSPPENVYHDAVPQT